MESQSFCSIFLEFFQSDLEKSEFPVVNNAAVKTAACLVNAPVGINLLHLIVEKSCAFIADTCKNVPFMNSPIICTSNNLTVNMCNSHAWPTRLKHSNYAFREDVHFCFVKEKHVSTLVYIIDKSQLHRDKQPLNTLIHIRGKFGFSN